MTAYDRDLTTVVTWVNEINQHWHRTRGDLHSDKEFWQTCMHDSNQRWQAWSTVWPALRVQYAEHARRYPYLDQDTKDCERSLHRLKPVVKPHKPSANFAAFRAVMAIKDFLNDCADEPTVQYTAAQRVHSDRPSDEPFDRLFSTQ